MSHKLKPEAPELTPLASPERLAAVEGLELLDAPREPGLDRLTWLAAKTLGAPAALISLAADRQVAVSAYGVDVTPESRESPLNETFCQYVVATALPLNIADARNHPWVARTPAVQCGKVWSYLGVPLVDAQEQVLGTLCVFDSQPRQWPDGAEEVLARLGEAVVHEFELRAVGERLRSVSQDLAVKDERLRLALRAGQMGTWDWDPLRQQVRCDEHAAALLGMTCRDGPVDLQVVLDRVEPDDAGALRLALGQAFAAGTGFENEFRVRQADGRHRWLLGRTSPQDAGPSQPGLTGVLVDVTDRHVAGERLTRTLERIADAFFALDRDYCFTYVNAEAERLIARRREDLLGRNVWEVFPETVGYTFKSNYDRALQQGEPVEFEEYYAPLRAWFEVRAFPGPDGLSVYFRDLSLRKREQIEREELLANRAQAVARTQGLLRFSSRLSEARTPEEVVRVLFDEGFQLLDTNCGALVLRADEPGMVEFRMTGYVEDTGWARVPVDQPWPVVESAVTGQAVLIESRHALREQYPDLCEEILFSGAAALIALPLVASGSPVGALSVTWNYPRVFEEDDLAFLRTLASLCGQALERARLYAGELERLALTQDRERIARDLHDTVIQRLFATGLTLQRAQRSITQEQIALQVQGSVQELDRTVREIRSTIFGLSFPHGRGVPLRNHVSTVVAELAEALAVTYELRFDAPSDFCVRAEVADHLAPTLREALANVARHASARRVAITFTIRGGHLLLEVVDDGIGFDPATAHRGQGLRNLAQRAASLGGTLEVQRPPGGGTCLAWRVPLQASGTGLAVSLPDRRGDVAP